MVVTDIKFQKTFFLSYILTPRRGVAASSILSFLLRFIGASRSGIESLAIKNGNATKNNISLCLRAKAHFDLPGLT